MAGHRVLYRKYFEASTKVFMWDPCPFGYLEAHGT